MHHIIFGPNTLKHDLVARYAEVIATLQRAAKMAMDGNVDERAKAYIELSSFSEEIGKWHGETLKLFAEWRCKGEHFTALVDKWNSGEVYGFTKVQTETGERVAVIANTDRGALSCDGASAVLGWMVKLGRIGDLGLSKP